MTLFANTIMEPQGRTPCGKWDSNDYEPATQTSVQGSCLADPRVDSFLEQHETFTGAHTDTLEHCPVFQVFHLLSSPTTPR